MTKLSLQEVETTVEQLLLIIGRLSAKCAARRLGYSIDKLVSFFPLLFFPPLVLTCQAHTCNYRN